MKSYLAQSTSQKLVLCSTCRLPIIPAGCLTNLASYCRCTRVQMPEAERATPAAASAGAAGTIDTPTLRNLLGDLWHLGSDNNADCGGLEAVIIRHIDQHTAAARAECASVIEEHVTELRAAAARIAELERSIGQYQQERDELAESLRAATAPVSAAPTAPSDVIEMLLEVAHRAYDLMDNCEERGGAEEDAEYVVTGADFEALSTAMDRLEALPDDQPGYVMGPAAKARWALERGQSAGAPVSDQIAISLRHQREDTERIVATLRSEPSAEALEFYSSVGAPVSAAEPAQDVCAEMRALCSACGGTGDVTSIDGEWRGSCDCAASKQPADGQELPALPDLPRYTEWSNGAAIGFDISKTGRWVLFCDVQQAWVKRADLAMGQAQGDLTDAQIVAAMRPHLDKADGGFACDTHPDHVATAGRAAMALGLPQGEVVIGHARACSISVTSYVDTNIMQPGILAAGYYDLVARPRAAKQAEAPHIDGTAIICDTGIPEVNELLAALDAQDVLKREIRANGMPRHADFWVQPLEEAQERVDKARAALATKQAGKE